MKVINFTTVKLIYANGKMVSTTTLIIIAVFVITIIAAAIGVSVWYFYYYQPESNNNSIAPTAPTGPAPSGPTGPTGGNSGTSGTSGTSGGGNIDGGSNNNGNQPCTPKIVGACRKGWTTHNSKSQTDSWGVGGLQWEVNPVGCATDFTVEIDSDYGSKQFPVSFDPVNDPVLPIDKNNFQPIFSVAVQGRNTPLTADAFRNSTTTWKITPAGDNKTTVTYKLDKDSKGRCSSSDGYQGNGFSCITGDCH